MGTTVIANPLLLDFPDHFETKRLLIRAPRIGDGQIVNEAILESIDNLRQWMLWAKEEPTLENAEIYTRESAAKFITRESLPMLLFRKSDGLFVGSSGMHSLDWSVPRAAIGYWIRTSLQGQGYMTEAVNGICTFAFDTLKMVRLEIGCDAQNTRSRAVAERAGFKLEAHLRNERRSTNGDLCDSLIFGKLAEEHKADNG